MKKRIISIIDTRKKRTGFAIICTALIVILGIGLVFAFSEINKSILYENLSIGFSMQIPTSWEGKYSIKELDQTHGDEGTIKSISLSHNATMDELGSDVGWLFSISRVTGEDYTENEPPVMSGQTIILAQTGGYTYFINFPSGVEYNEDPESESAVEYKEMESQVDFLINTFKLIER